MKSVWPQGFVRVPEEDWTQAPVEELALKYDTVEQHGWYKNLDPTVAELGAHLGPGSLVLDYSGGTGILAVRLLDSLPGLDFGVLIADASPKFLRLALNKLGGEERVAFRLLRYLKEARRLQTMQEVLEPAALERGFDAVASTNAIHLYYDLEDTLRSWRKLLAPGGKVFVQSGNIGLSEMEPDTWIIDATVEAIQAAAIARVQSEERWAAFRPVLGDAEKMAAYDALRRKIFLPVRPLDYYLAALEAAGFESLTVRHQKLEAQVSEWREFLAAYHEGVLGWAGGVAKIAGQEPTPEAVAARLELLALSLDDIFSGRPSFQAVWTYITGR
ncbi:MAG: class I SAM-dependent methyltransferase [Thermoanaerobaculia bacterium]